MKDISIVSLCQEMGVSRKTFYQYFDTIEDVLYIMIDKELRTGFLLLEYDPQIKEFFEFWKKNRSLLDILEKNAMSNILVERAYVFSNITQENNSTIQNMKYAGWIASLITVLILWHHGGMLQTEEEMCQTINEMFNIGRYGY